MTSDMHKMWQMLVILVVSILLTTQPAAAGIKIFAPVETFIDGEKQKLDFSPSKIVFGGASAFVIGQTTRDLGTVVKLDPETLEERARQDLNMMPQDIVASPGGEFFFLVGNDGKSSIVLALDGDLGVIGRLILPQLLGSPSISLSSKRRLIIGSLRTAFSNGAFITVDTTDITALTLAKDVRAALAWRGVTDVWLSETENTIFLNGAPDVGLFAVDLARERLLSDISYGSSKQASQEPFSIFGLIADEPCRADAGTSFLIADNERDTLTLVDYDSSFRTLDIMALVRNRPKLVLGADIELYSGTHIARPAALIASSCDQSVIWLGNLYSRQITQFARNPDASLEKVGIIDLQFQPRDMVISDDGAFALAISQSPEIIARFDRAETTRSLDPGTGNGTAPATPPDNVSIDIPRRVIGNDSVREIQRLLTKNGLPVGSIDGIIGSNTLRAIDIVESRYKIQLDVTGDLEGTLETLRSTLNK